jgi:serine phosphatase RsbU (regulator of sigma subunit)
LFYTDGLTDARVAPGSHERFGEERLKKWLERTGGRPLDQQIVDELVADIQAANGGPFADDVALLAISVKDQVEQH